MRDDEERRSRIRDNERQIMSDFWDSLVLLVVVLAVIVPILFGVIGLWFRYSE